MAAGREHEDRLPAENRAGVEPWVRRVVAGKEDGSAGRLRTEVARFLIVVDQPGLFVDLTADNEAVVAEVLCVQVVAALDHTGIIVPFFRGADTAEGWGVEAG